MRHECLSGLLRSRMPGYSLPAALYAGAEAFEADLDAIFLRSWLNVAVVADVPEPGDVYAVDIGRSPVVIVRDDEGGIRAFHNVCSHRGARLVPEGRSIVGKLVCPYHQWTYELTGDLIDAPHMGLDFDKALHDLQPVNVREIGGLIYVCLSNDPPEDIEALAALMGQRLAPYNLAHTKVAAEQEIVEHGNWKLTVENNRECYHCASNHPELALSFHASDFGFDPAALAPEEKREAEALATLYAERTAAWEACGLPSEAVESDVLMPTNYRTQRLIIAGAGESQTPNARAAVKVPLGPMVANGAGDVHLWGINAWAHFMGDHAVVFNLFPLGPDRTLVRTKWLVHEDAEEGVDYDVANLTAVWTETNRQDADLVALAHQGVRSAGYRPGPYSRFTERTLNDWTTWYVARMMASGYA
ncbi:SRPBCC family protein [Acuticoccus sp. MNP-M23]|uniref:aromatic ring-hydroxylating oxygenase subunit alpha n=1 Tax=Acuticoccus sp. MNP-M23 TaxID=3072793 RepID=UPI0028163E7F|nr:SRPBCC family protein [Acuticoccus sp. MNP-M23]WMS45033.1 SRPBCC family protein [Acuticoccus sp. MNP-M23]